MFWRTDSFLHYQKQNSEIKQIKFIEGVRSVWRDETNQRIRFRCERSQGEHMQTLLTEESERKEESQGRYLYVLMAITEERHILKMVCAFLMICAFGLLLGCENIVPIQCFVNQFGFRASRKGTEQVESVVCAFADGNADPDSFFFLLVHNGIFLCVWFVV